MVTGAVLGLDRPQFLETNKINLYSTTKTHEINAITLDTYSILNTGPLCMYVAMYACKENNYKSNNFPLNFQDTNSY